jgi:hypothetical protein
MNLQQRLGEMSLDDVLDPLYDNTLQNLLSKDSITAEGEEFSEASTCTEQGGEEDNEGQPCHVFDPMKFPLLHSLWLYRKKFLNSLIQGMVIFFGKESISFRGINNQNKDLFLMPTCRTRQQYDAELLKKELIGFAKNADCSSV